MILETIQEYKEIAASVDRLIKASGYKIAHVQKEMGMNNASFYQKRKQAKFTPDELQKLFTIINIDKLEDKVLAQMSFEGEKTDSITLEEAFSDGRD